MNNFLLLVSIVAFGLGLLISILKNLKEDYPKIYRITESLLYGLAASVVSSLIVLLFQIQNNNIELEKRLADIEIHLEENNSFSRVNSMIYSLSENDKKASKDYFEKVFSDLDEKLNKLENGVVRLNESEVIDTWSFLIEHAQRDIKALNVLVDWENVSTIDSFGIRQQKLALEKGVKITRINLYTDNTHKEGLRKLMDNQARLLDSEYFETKMNSADLIKEGRNQILYKELQTPDFLIIDDNLLMKSFYPESHFGVRYAEVIRDEDVIKSAIELFNNLNE